MQSTDRPSRTPGSRAQFRIITTSSRDQYRPIQEDSYAGHMSHVMHSRCLDATGGFFQFSLAGSLRDPLVARSPPTEAVSFAHGMSCSPSFPNGSRPMPFRARDLSQGSLVGSARDFPRMPPTAVACREREVIVSSHSAHLSSSSPHRSASICSPSRCAFAVHLDVPPEIVDERRSATESHSAAATWSTCRDQVLTAELDAAAWQCTGACSMNSHVVATNSAAGRARPLLDRRRPTLAGARSRPMRASMRRLCRRPPWRMPVKVQLELADEAIPNSRSPR